MLATLKDYLHEYEATFCGGGRHPELRDFFRYLHLKGGTHPTYPAGHPVWYRSIDRMLYKDPDRYWYRGTVLTSSLEPPPDTLLKKASARNIHIEDERGVWVQNIDSSAKYWVLPTSRYVRDRTKNSDRPLMQDVDWARLSNVKDNVNGEFNCKPHDDGFGDLHGLGVLKAATSGQAFLDEDSAFHSVLGTIDPKLFLRLAQHVYENKHEDDRVRRVQQILKRKAAAPVSLHIDQMDDVAQLKKYNSDSEYTHVFQVRGHDGRHRVMSWVTSDCDDIPVLLRCAKSAKSTLLQWATSGKPRPLDILLVGESNPKSVVGREIPPGQAVLTFTYDPIDKIRVQVRAAPNHVLIERPEQTSSESDQPEAVEANQDDSSSGPLFPIMADSTSSSSESSQSLSSKPAYTHPTNAKRGSVSDQALLHDPSDTPLLKKARGAAQPGSSSWNPKTTTARPDDLLKPRKHYLVEISSDDSDSESDSSSDAFALSQKAR